MKKELVLSIVILFGALLTPLAALQIDSNVTQNQSFHLYLNDSFVFDNFTNNNYSYAPNLTTISLAPGNCSTDSISGTTYCAAMPIVISLPQRVVYGNYSQNTTIAELNVTFVAPPFPKINLNKTMNSPQSWSPNNYSYNGLSYSYGLNVTWQYDQIAKTITLSYSPQCLGLSGLTRQYCFQSNPTTTNYTDANHSLIVLAPPFPEIDKTEYLQDNDTIYYVDWNYTVIPNYTRTTIPIVSKSLNFGECTNNSYCNVCAPQNLVLGINRNLTDQQNYSLSAYNLFIGCNAQCQAVTLSANVTCPIGWYCFPQNNVTIANCTNPLSVADQTGAGRYSICLDNFSNFCSADELLTGNMRGCLIRWTSQLNTTLQQTTQQLIQTQSDLNRERSGQASRDTIVQQSNDNMNTIAIVVFLVVLAITALVYAVRHARIPILPPKEPQNKVEEIRENVIKAAYQEK